MQIWGRALFVAILVLAGLERAQAQQPEQATARSHESTGSEAVRIDSSSVKPTHSSDEFIARWLAQAEEQLARLALTTPVGDNAYETYLRILSLQPKYQAALDGIENIGIKYVALAELAASEGNLEGANLYARKAAILAPEHPLVLSMTMPFVAQQAIPEATVLTSESLGRVKAQQTQANEPKGAGTTEVAATSLGDAKLEGLIESADNLVFAPQNYQGRQVVVTGSVVHLFWDYRLKAATGQNSLVVDVGGLSQDDRAKLESAVERAGFLGQVRARISGRIERQGLATFKLAARELMLDTTDPSKEITPAPTLEPTSDEAIPLVVTLYPDEPFGQTNGDRNGSSDRDGARGRSANSNGRDASADASSGSSGGTSGAGNNNSGNGNSGNGNSGNGNSGNNNSGNNNSGNGNSGNGDRDDGDRDDGDRDD